ncbi:transposase [Robbsia sp. KACC 23696]|uniref:transposase n=1 Tax=Robbsia sp. KACC 23696 TaxID=3149231 RepID=UPI00325AFA21
MPQHVILPVRVGVAAFRADDDIRFFLDTLRGAARANGLAIHAYALTPAIVHLLGTPRDADSVSKTVQAVGRRYVAWFNRRYGAAGALWDGRYRATVLDPDAYLLSTSILIEAAAEPALPQLSAHRQQEIAHAAAGAPAADALTTGAAIGDTSDGKSSGVTVARVEARRAEGSSIDTLSGPRKSSYPHHAGLAIDPAITDHALYWALGNTPFERHRRYRAQAEQPLDPAASAQALDAARKGWVRGNDAFTQRCERLANRRLTPLRRGRPKKVNNDDDLTM